MRGGTDINQLHINCTNCTMRRNTPPYLQAHCQSQPKRKIELKKISFPSENKKYANALATLKKTVAYRLQKRLTDLQFIDSED